MTAHAAAGATLLSVRDLTKIFPGLCALDRVSLQVRSGEVVALLGQNGSGKSTLVKVLAGIHKADAGQVELAPGGEGSGPSSLHFIHQDLGLVETLSTVENLGLAHRNAGLRRLRRRREVDRARELIAGFGVTFDVLAPVRTLTPAQQSVVAIARAMDGWLAPQNVLVLDEPTASLHGEEVRILFTAVQRVAQQGAGVLFISHRLDEVTELADRVVVLRDGTVVAEQLAAGLTPRRLAELITGRAMADTPAAPPGDAKPERTALSVRGIRGGRVTSLDLDLWPGEIVGVAGSLGSGREDLNRLLYGAERLVNGAIAIDGMPVQRHGPHESLRRGVAYVPSDRRAHGAVMTASLRENLTLPQLRPLTWGGFHLRAGRERRDVNSWMQSLDIRPVMPERPLGLFSGGNQQKVVMAKWLRVAPRILLVDEPTQGVDVGASEAIRALLVAAAESGMALLVSSSDNADLVRMCSRALVLRDGVVTAELHDNEISEHRLTQECLGASDPVASARAASGPLRSARPHSEVTHV
jgi:ABC-type sugar transport system ATPase subunit